MLASSEQTLPPNVRPAALASNAGAAVSCALLLCALLPGLALGGGSLAEWEAEVQRLATRVRPTLACVEAWGPGQPVSVGSGVVTTDDGVVITASSVVRGADRVRVRVPTRGVFPARVVGTDPLTNLAVLQIDDVRLPAATLADPSPVPLGTWVMILGNSYGAGPTISVGMVSGRRPGYGLDDSERILQVNAAVNPGDSGAPLFNSSGEVIGILFAATSPSEEPRSSEMVGQASAGLPWASGGTVGFAIPIGAGKSIADEIRAAGRVVRGFLGVKIRGFTPEERQRRGLEQECLYVEDVFANSPAEQAGFLEGDVLIAVDGKPIGMPRALQRLVARSRPHATLRVDIERNGQRRELVTEIGELPATLAEGPMQAARARQRSAAAAPDGDLAAEMRKKIDLLTAQLDALRLQLRTAEGPR